MAEETDIAGAVVRQVLRPMAAGGKVRPLEPIGAKRAQELAGAQGVVTTSQELEEVLARRIRVARELVPIDALGDLDHGEWLLAFALNDLLQATNPTLTDWFGANRPRQLLEMVRESVASAGPPRTLQQVLARHATFARVMALTRIDTTVSWWVGSETFRGLAPPQRLLRWKSLRRVRTQQQRSPLPDMVEEEDTFARRFHDVLGAWLAATPLTDLACANRPSPRFVWRGSTIAVLATPWGRNVAYRAVAGSESQRATVQALSRAAAEVDDPRARAVIDGFLADFAN